MTSRALVTARSGFAGSLLVQATGIALFAAATAAGAQIRVPVPGTPVPITLQVFFVILSGMLLGSKAGAASQALCMGCGAAGLPFFAGGGFGLHYMAGPTGGYLLSFPFAAAMAGTASSSRRLIARLAACTGSVLVVYLSGAAWLALSLSLAPKEAFEAGVLPFILADSAKAAAAAVVGRLAVLPGGAGLRA